MTKYAAYVAATASAVLCVTIAAPAHAGRTLTTNPTFYVFDPDNDSYIAPDEAVVVTRQLTYKNQTVPYDTCTKTSADYCDGTNDYARTAAGEPWLIVG